MANISDIEGIGPSYAEKLTAAGVNTVEKLLSEAGPKAGREALAETTGISESDLLTWVNMADLMRVDGVGPQFAEILVAAGVDSSAELARRNAENLAAKLEEVNEEKKLVGRLPNAEAVAKMVEDAKSLDKVVTH